MYYSGTEQLQKSQRHHYLPRYFINAFLNEHNTIFVYDKLKDKIHKSPRSSKSIFYINNRNTVRLSPTKSTSDIEDLVFQFSDNEISKRMIALQREPNNKELLTKERLAFLHYFVIDIFWRSPATDVAYSDMMRNSQGLKPKLNKEPIEESELYKLLRPGLIFETVQNIKNIPNREFVGKINETYPNQFVIGDFPVLFKELPRTLAELNSTDYCLALASNRFYLNSSQEFMTITLLKAVCYNVCIIDQSLQYICSGDLKLLKDSVEYYKKVKALQSEDYMLTLRNTIFT